MRRTKFIETQLVEILKDLDTNKLALEIAREHRISKVILQIGEKNTTAW